MRIRLAIPVLLLLSSRAVCQIAVANDALIREDADTYTAAAGTNRLLVLLLAAEDAAGAANPLFGGEPFIDVGTDMFAGSGGANTYIGCILDADIPTGSNQLTMTTTGFSWDGAANDLWSGRILTLTGARQTCVPDPAANEVNQTVPATSWNTGNVVSVTGGILVALCTADSAMLTGGQISGWTSWQENENGGGWLAGYKPIATGMSEGAVCDFNGTTLDGASVIAGFAPATSSRAAAFRLVNQP